MWTYWSIKSPEVHCNGIWDLIWSLVLSLTSISYQSQEGEGGPGPQERVMTSDEGVRGAAA